MAKQPSVIRTSRETCVTERKNLLREVKKLAVIDGESLADLYLPRTKFCVDTLALLELATGMRRGEICALKWDNLNFRTGALRIERQVIRVASALHVSEPKTKNSFRTVILPPTVVTVRRELKERTGFEWLFPSPVLEDSQVDPQSVTAK